MKEPLPPSLIDGNDRRLPSAQGSKRWRLIIGLLQLIPLVGGVLLTEHRQPMLFPLDYVVMGLVFSLAIGYLLSNKVPPPPVQFRYEQ